MDLKELLILGLPVICLASYGLVAMVLVPAGANNRLLGGVGLFGLVVTGGALYRAWVAVEMYGPQETAFGMIRIDGFGLFFSWILLIVTLLSMLGSIAFLEREGADQGEFYPLLLLCLAGMFMMIQTTNLIMVLIGLEVFSLALYVMTGLTRYRVRSVEAALKYFLLGAFSSGFMVYGMALLYGSTGSLDMNRIGSVVARDASPMLWVGMGLMLIGLAFKIAIVPFHQWVPDVYQGAPTNVTGFMAAATKTAVIAVLVRFLIGAFGNHAEVWGPLIQGLAILTMTVANLVALAQTNLKRMLAFSSIAHAGYLLIAVVCRPAAGVGAILFYLVSYAFMTIGAFTVLGSVGRGDSESERGYTLNDWAGIGWKKPMIGVAMTFFLLSLAGIPPTGGFLGKYVIFSAAIDSGKNVLAVIGMLNAAIAAYYYLRVIVVMYMRESESDEPLPLVAPSMAVVMIISVVGVMYLGLAPGRLLELVQQLARTLS